jgi:hypothetical protein
MVIEFIGHLYTPLGTTSTAPLLISTFYRSRQYPLNFFQPAMFSTAVPYSSARTTSKTPMFYCFAHVHFRGNVFTDPLVRNGWHNPIVLLSRACMLWALSNNGCCLQSHHLARGLYVTISVCLYSVRLIWLFFFETHVHP